MTSRRRWARTALVALAVALSLPATLPAQALPDSAKLEALKVEALRRVEGRAKQVQEIVDMLFSFSELGMQEFETQRYITDLLQREGFQITKGYAGMPSAWVARWVSPAGAKPVVTLGSDVDGIPQASNKPAFAFHEAQVEGAPGHGEGHNSGQAVNIVAALVAKELMIRERIPGTLVLWPGIAEEQMAGKAFLVREGLFRDADVALFTHVGSDLGVQWGQSGSTALVSAIFKFKGTSAHAAGAPWRGRSALDAAMLMGQGWEYQREHLEINQRSHYVIRDGGDQPNVVPATASVWYFLRELDAPRIRTMWAMADSVAQGAAMMTGTRLANVRVMGAAWPPHFNRPVAEALARNIERVGMPRWSEDDQRFARAIQQEMGQPQRGLTTTPKGLEAPPADDQRKGGGSDDIGDVSWAVPTVQLFYPSNVPGTPGHNWADAIAMATPIAHKGATAGAKALALTVYDVLTSPALVADAWRYYREVQTKDVRYESFVRPQDRPSTELNAAILARYRDQMRPFYYDASRFPTYLDQLGVKYPTLRGADGSCGAKAVP